MKRTPQEFRRENVKKLFDKVLQLQKTKLQPLSIIVSESCESDFTSIDLSYSMSKGQSTNSFDIKVSEAKGFVDGIFKACYNTFLEEHPSLANIELHDYKLKPNFAKTIASSGSDAKVEVTIMMEVRDHGIAEFSSTSRSILHSSFIATLEAFQFYINCERTFRKIKLSAEDASTRNRGDILQLCLVDLSVLTAVNTYAS